MKNPFLLFDISLDSCVSCEWWLISGLLEPHTKQGCGMHHLESPSSRESWMLDLHTLNLCRVTPAATA